MANKTLKDSLNDANPTLLATILQKLNFGDVVRCLPTQLLRKAASLPLDMIANVWTIALPDDAKAAVVHRARILAGSAGVGPLTIDGVMSAATATTHIGVSESGDLTFALGDAPTSVDVLYTPVKQDVVTLTLPVVAATGVCALPAGITTQGVISILAASIVTPVPTVCHVVAPAAAAPANAGDVCLNLAKSSIFFRIADNVTVATVKLGLVPAVNVDTLLEADATVL
jgi:hypothetical protein